MSAADPAHWDRLASEYEPLAAGLDPAGSRRKNELIHELHVRAMRPYVRGRVLDFGCGTGRLMRAFPGATGVDISPRMVEIAKRWGDAHVYDGDTLPFPNRSFDTVLSAYVLQMFRDNSNKFERLLDEITRVLERGGNLVAVERVEETVPELSRRAWRRALGGLSVRRVRPVRRGPSRLDQFMPLPTSVLAPIHRLVPAGAYTDMLFVAQRF